MSFTYPYARPALTVDIVVFGYHDDLATGETSLDLLLIERGIEPFKGHWALPGGYVRVEESVEDAARRELREEAGVRDIFMEQLYTFGNVDRDPRERTVTVAYFALIEKSHYNLQASTDAADVKWVPVSKIPKLPYDHNEIVKMAMARLRMKLRYEPIGFELLPKKFTLTQMQNLYETVLDRQLDKRNFRKKVLSFGVLKELDRKIENVPYRSPSLYSFDEAKYRALAKKGLKYEI